MNAVGPSEIPPMALRYSWDPSKAANNLRKHGISFREAMTCFENPLSLTIADADHSVGEARFILVGTSVWQRLIVVSVLTTAMKSG
jgi:uncharacterized protein